MSTTSANIHNDYNQSPPLADVKGTVTPIPDASFSSTRPTISFQDIENLLPPFSGNKNENISHWINRFENLAQSFNFTELQKFIFLERALKGLALLFVRSEPNLTSYITLKEALLREFGQYTNAAQIHQMLANRHCRSNESFMEYFLHMKDLANRGPIDDKSLMHYVVNGIRDSPNNKSILYGCACLTEFKQKLLIYSEIRAAARHAPPTKPANTAQRDEKKHSNNTDIPASPRCYNCGASGHKSASCLHKHRGLKCFNCNDFGHKSADCTKTRNSRAKPISQDNCPPTSGTTRQDTPIHVVDLGRPPKNIQKLVKISGIAIYSLIDTGSPVTLVREDAYRLLNSPPLSPVPLQLTGFGSGNVIPLGSFPTDIEIDDNVFSTTAYVIGFPHMSLPIILGTDVILQGTLTCDESGVSLTKPHSSDMFINFINVCDSTAEIDLTHLSDPITRNEVATLINQYRPMQTKSTNLKMSIIVTDDIPIYQRPRRMSIAEKKIVSDQIAQWLRDGIIKPSCSDYASPVVLVKKKNGSTRLCIDFRKLNKKIVKDRFPLPLIDDVLDQLKQSKVFTSLDLKNGFFHVDVDPLSTKYTAFITHDGHFEFLKVPFGLSTSPAVFSRYLSCVFRDLLSDGTLILYMDDLIIPSQTVVEGLEKLKRVLHTASNYGLEINFQKCNFLHTKIEFLGHIIENNTLQPSPTKIKAVQNFPEPKNVKQLQSLLGLTSYFRKFIPGYASIAKPLSDLLRQSATFEFGPPQREALTKLKHSLTNPPVLHIFIPGSELEVHTDASKYGFGAVLMQRSSDGQFHPVQYMSKKTTPQEEKLSSYELEVLAIIEALKKFRVYLHGTKFKIVTDCQAFQKTLDKKDLTPKIARWALFLQDFDYEIAHRPATKMTHVDCLSRYPIFHITYDELTQRIIRAQSTDPLLSTIKTTAAQNPINDFVLRNGILYRIVDDRELLVVPDCMQLEIIQAAHNNGHFSSKKTADIVSQEFYIPQLTQLVQKITTNCIQCILSSRKSGKPEGYLHSIPKGDTPLDTYHIDFLGPLPSTNKNYNYLFTVVDAFTKFIWIYPVKSTSTLDALNKLKFQQSFFGNPRRIISDKGSAFTSNDFKTFCDTENIEHVTITTGVPRGNGQIERFHATLIPVLTKLSLNDPTKWYKHISALQRILNSTVSSTTNFTPFELLTGIKMRNKEDLAIKEILDSEYQQVLVHDKLKLREIAKNNILQHQDLSRKLYNKKRKPASVYNVGDLVAIQRTQFGTGLKLREKYFGPYKITSVKPNDRYEVQKLGHHSGPHVTSSSADLMKPWRA